MENGEWRYKIIMLLITFSFSAIITKALNGCEISVDVTDVIPAIPIDSYVANTTKLETLFYDKLVTMPKTYTTKGTCDGLLLKDHAKDESPVTVTKPGIFESFNATSCDLKETNRHFMFQFVTPTKLSELNFYYICESTGYTQPKAPKAPKAPKCVKK